MYGGVIGKRDFCIMLFHFAFLSLWQSGYGQVVIVGDNSHLIEDGWIHSTAVATLETMKLNYTKPEGFNEAYQYSECFTPSSKLYLMLGCIDNKLYTEKEDFIAFMPVRRLLSPEAIARWKKMIPNFPYNVDSLHRSQIKNIIKQWYGDKAGEEWRKYVDYYPSAEAKTKFNADTAITFTIELTPDAYYNDRYKYLDVFLIQRIGRGFQAFYSFYDEEGKKKRASYQKALEGVLRFED